MSRYYRYLGSFVLLGIVLVDFVYSETLKDSQQHQIIEDMRKCRQALCEHVCHPDSFPDLSIDEDEKCGECIVENCSLVDSRELDLEKS